MTLPTNGQTTAGTKGWQITETLYVTEDGRAVTINGGFASSYDGKDYRSNNIHVENLGQTGVKKQLPVNEDGTPTYSRTATINGLEVEVTYLYNGEQFIRIDLSGATVTLDAATAKQVLYQRLPDEAATGPRITFFAGQQIQLERRTDKVAADLTGKLYYAADGETGWKLMNSTAGADHVLSAQDDRYAQSGAVTVKTVTSVYTDGNITYTFIAEQFYDAQGNRVAVFFTFPDGSLRIGFDGSVKRTEEAALTQEIVPVSGVGYYIRLISAAKDVTLWLLDSAGSVLDGDRLTGGEDDVDIKANTENGIINVYAESSGSFGTDTDFLEMEAAKINYMDLAGGRVVTVDQYIYVTNGDFTLDDPTLVKGAKLTIVTRDGRILGNNLIIQDVGGRQGTVIFKTNRLEQKENGLVTGHPANPDALSTGDIILGNISMKASDLSFESAGDILLHYVGAVGSTLSLTAEGVSTDKTHGSILFDSIITKGSTIHLNAKKTIAKNDGVSCGEYGDRAFIKTANTDSDANAGVFLSAGESIGTAESRLVLDLPTALTLHLPSVHDFYLDALQLILAGHDANGNPAQIEVGDTPILAVELVTHPDNPQINEFFRRDPKDVATVVSGDHLQWINNQDILVAVKSQTPAELAAWIMLREQRGEWTAQLEAAVVKALLGADKESKGYTAKEIAALMGSKHLVTLLSGESLSALATQAAGFGESTLSKITSAGEMVNHLSAAQLKAIFHNLTERQKTLAGLAPEATTITAAQLTALYGNSPAGMRLGTLLGYMDSSFKAQLSLRNNPNKAIDTVKDSLGKTNGSTLVYSEIIKALTETMSGTLSGQKEAAPAGSIYATAYESAKAFLTRLLTLQTSSAEGPVALPNLGRLLGSLLTGEELEELYQRAMQGGKFPTGSYNDPETRSQRIEIGTSTGEAHYYNDGSITIIQENGDLTVGEILSERGDLTLMTKLGSIIAQYDAEGKHDGVHLLGRKINLSAKGSIGDSSAPLIMEHRDNAPNVVVGVDESQYYDPNYTANRPGGTAGTTLVRMLRTPQKYYTLRQVMAIGADGKQQSLWILDVRIRYDWVRLDDAMTALRLDAAAENGSITLTEKTGNVGLGSVSAPLGTVSLQIPGSITDLRTAVEQQTGIQNLTAADATLFSGGNIGTTQQRLAVKVTGKLTAKAAGKIALNAADSLTAILDSTHGAIYVDAKNDLTLRNTSASGSLLIGLLRAGGTADITAVRAILEGDRLGANANIKADSIRLLAGGVIGSASNPFEIDTMAGNTGRGTLAAAGESLYLREVSGDLTLDQIQATGGSAALSAPGSIRAVNGNSNVTDAAKAQQQAIDAEDQAAAALTKAKLLERAAAQQEAAATAAALAAQDGQNAVTDAENRAAALNGLAATLQSIRSNSALSDEQQAAQIAGALHAAGFADEKALAKEQSAQDLRLATLRQNLLSLQQNSTLGAANAADVRNKATAARAKATLAQQQATADRNRANALAVSVSSGNTTVSTTGDLTMNAGGSIGSTASPIGMQVGGEVTLTAGRGAGDEIAVTQNGTLRLGHVTTGGKTVLSATGSIIDTGSGTAIAAGSTELYALGGNIGSTAIPLTLNTPVLSVKAGNISLHMLTDTLIQSISGSSLTLTGSGDIGAPLKVWISSKPVVVSQLGQADYRNYYTAGSSDHERYDTFWYDIRNAILDAEAGATITANAGSRTDLPTYVLEALLRRMDVTFSVYWDGGSFTIPAGKALMPDDNTALYPLDWLGQQYGGSVNPLTGGQMGEPDATPVDAGAILPTEGTLSVLLLATIIFFRRRREKTHE